MVNLSGIPPSRNFEDRTGQSLMEGRIRQEYTPTPQEEEWMKKNGWNFQDILVMRALRQQMQHPTRRGPDYPPEG